MRQTLIDILSSKKALAAILATAAAIAGKLGFDLDTESILTITAPLIAYIIGQGVADHGKEAAKENAKAALGAKPVAVDIAVIPATASGE